MRRQNDPGSDVGTLLRPTRRRLRRNAVLSRFATVSRTTLRQQDICIASFREYILITKTLRMARIDEDHKFYSNAYPRIELTVLPLIPNRSASPHFGRYLFSVP